MAHFYGWGSTTSSIEPLRGGSLLQRVTQFADKYKSMLTIK